ncbi:MAG: YeeE/YedE thiosulfate transporter family protein [Nevskiales bacterium]|nr:YeeE/YedE thiosulfate transporter family protein [Nevskiales bacterium]
MTISSVASGLIGGLIFGFALERAGFASGCKLTAQLRFKDWAVFKVMFTAILVCAVGLYVLDLAGVMTFDSIYIPTTYFWATLLGGVGVGAGMAIGGYCPGTSVVSFMSGRIDGLVFFFGLLFGTVGFAGVYERLEPLLDALPGPEAQTVPELLHVPTWVVLVALIAVAVTVGWLTRDKSSQEVCKPTSLRDAGVPMGAPRGAA